MSEHTESYFQKMQQLHNNSTETNTLNLQIGEQPGLAHLATLATALVLGNVYFELDRKNRLKVALPKEYKKGILGTPHRLIAVEGVHGVSREEQPNVRSYVKGSTTREHSILPDELGSVLFDRKNMQVSTSTIELATSQQALGPKPQVIRLLATHTGFFGKHINIELSNNTDAPDEFKGLIELIQDTEEVEQPNDGYRNIGIASKRIVSTITNNPERHFDFHGQLGINTEQIAHARQQFNLLAEYFEIPFKVAA